MDLSAETLDGLQLIGDSSFISDKVFSLLATKTCESLLDKSKKNDVLGEQTRTFYVVKPVISFTFTEIYFNAVLDLYLKVPFILLFVFRFQRSWNSWWRNNKAGTRQFSNIIDWSLSTGSRFR